MNQYGDELALSAWQISEAWKEESGVDHSREMAKSMLLGRLQAYVPDISVVDGEIRRGANVPIFWHLGDDHAIQQMVGEKARYPEIEKQLACAPEVHDLLACARDGQSPDQSAWARIIIYRSDLLFWCENYGIAFPLFWSAEKPEKPSEKKKHRGPKPLQPMEVANAFGGIHWSHQQWRKNLGDPPQWLLPARVTSPKRGRHSPGLWDPIKVALCLIERHNDENVFVQIRRRFDWCEQLAAWAPQWTACGDIG